MSEDLDFLEPDFLVSLKYCFHYLKFETKFKKYPAYKWSEAQKFICKLAAWNSECILP